jgi:hypothetical protein
MIVPYGLVVLIALVFLSGKFFILKEISWRLKALVMGLVAISLGWRYGFFLQAALGITLAIYFKYVRIDHS